MGDASIPPTKATVRFGIPDLSVTAEERALFSFPANKSITEVSTTLHDCRTDPEFVPGAAGLETQGFIYIKHRSALDGNRWYEGNNVEEIYMPETCDLICKLTGAKRAVIVNTAFRRRLVELGAPHDFVLLKDCPLDQELAQMPRDKAFAYGKDPNGALEPARAAHIDITVAGLQRTIGSCRKDIAAAGADYLSAIASKSASPPRVAEYSVWRPVETVKRDPLIVLDARTIDNSELQPFTYRHPSETLDSGEYMMEAYAVLPPKQPESQRWCWMSEQTCEDVLVLKLGDTESEKTNGVAGGVPHCSPHILGTEGEKARCSVEARVIAFW